jgi:hypothetical protein
LFGAGIAWLFEASPIVMWVLLAMVTISAAAAFVVLRRLKNAIKDATQREPPLG